MPEGTFSYDANEKVGEWTILQMTQPENVYKLTGSIRFGEGQVEMPSGITAVVNLKIPNHSFSGTSIEKITCAIGSNKDD